MNTMDEVSFAVNHALLKYNMYPVEKIYEKMDWLWRAAIYLRTGIDIKKQLAKSNDEKEKYNNALFKIDNEILPILKSIYNDEKIVALLYLAINKTDVNSAMKIIHYIRKINELRDKLVELSIATGFVVMRQLIIHDTVKKKRTKTSPFNSADFSEIEF